jgi:predicted amidohydrolase
VLPGYLPEDTESCGNALLLEWHNPDYVPEGRERPRLVRVASVQYQMRAVASFDEFATQVEFFVDTAAEYRADFVLFPELLTNQLLALVPADRPALSARRLAEFTPAYEELFGGMALRYAINIIAGTHLVVEDDKLYNVAYLFHRDGRIDRRYKTHITPAEQRWWGVSPGDGIDAIDTDCGKIGICICYDVEFPEAARILREQGAQILFVPYNTDLRSGHIRVRSCAQARCIENHMYAVTSGACGNLPMVEGADIHYARSAILTPSDVAFARDGIAEEATPNVEMMLVHDLDIALLRRTERTGTVRPWVDRREDVYRVVYAGRGG